MEMKLDRWRIKVLGLRHLLLTTTTSKMINLIQHYTYLSVTCCYFLFTIYKIGNKYICTGRDAYAILRVGYVCGNPEIAYPPVIGIAGRGGNNKTCLSGGLPE